MYCGRGITGYYVCVCVGGVLTVLWRVEKEKEGDEDRKTPHNQNSS